MRLILTVLIILVGTTVSVCQDTITLTLDNVEVVKRVEGQPEKVKTVPHTLQTELTDTITVAIKSESNVDYHSIGFDIIWQDTSVVWGGVESWGNLFPADQKQHTVNVWHEETEYVSVAWYVAQAVQPNTVGDKTVLTFRIYKHVTEEEKVELYFEVL